MKEDKTVPQLRFPEFTDAWKQRKLCEFVNFYSGLTYKPEDVNQIGTFVLRSSNVKNGEILDADNVYVNEDIAKSEKVQLGDIIVVVRNGSRDLIGKHATVKRSMPNTVIGAFMTGIRAKEYSFVNALLDTNQFEKEINKNLGATINQITGYMFSNMSFTIPSEEEQHKIGSFFTQLDNTITLQQRKLNSLQKLKKGLLQKMFPKKGENIPEIRFPKFSDAWKQRELNEIADTIDTGKSIFSKSNIGKFKILGSTGVIGFDEDYDYEGSFLLTARVGANAGNLYRSSGKVKITDNTVFIKSKFIDYLFYSLEKFNLKRLSFGTGQPLIKSSELKKLNISVPCDENEITKIEHFFITIDRTITLQQRWLFYTHKQS